LYSQLVLINKITTMNGTSNPEELHNIAKGTDSNKQIGKPGFVSPGTPAAPLVGEKDLTSALLSAKGTQTLRDNLIK